MPVDLNPHQDYLIREFAEEYLEAHMSRRDMMRRVLLITGSIPATAALLAKALDPALQVTILGSRKHLRFTDGGRELFDCAAQGRIDALAHWVVSDHFNCVINIVCHVA